MDIKEIKEMFNEDETVIEILSVRIEMITCKPEFKTTKKTIKKILEKHKTK